MIPKPGVINRLERLLFLGRLARRRARHRPHLRLRRLQAIESALPRLGNASIAKQSSPGFDAALDCFVATLLAMTRKKRKRDNRA
jgi:hypothetical protein